MSARKQGRTDAQCAAKRLNVRVNKVAPRLATPYLPAV